MYPSTQLEDEHTHQGSIPAFPDNHPF